MDVHDIFNAKLKDLVNDLVLICPEVPDFLMLRNAINLGVAVDRTSVQRYFARYVAGPYAEQIRASDERFFLNHTYTDTGADTDVIEKIKAVWSTLGDTNKETIWKYFRVLLLLSDACP